ncbi:RNase P subunit p30 family protein [Nanoarchaeota archaeon]
MIDIVFPNNNEKKFIEIAEKLDIKELCFIYKDKIKEIKSDNVKIYYGILTTPKNAIKYKVDLILIKGSEKGRSAIDTKIVDIVYELEDSTRSDHTHYRLSGLNHIMAKLAKTNKVNVGFSFSSLLNSKDKAVTFGRLRQNIRLMRKFKFNGIIASFAQEPYEMRSESDLKSLFISIGMHAKEAKDCLSNVKNKIKENLKKRAPGYVREGFTVE